MMNDKEEWRPVHNYEGLYEVSNMGRVKSLPRKATHGGILAQYVNPKNGYCYVRLSKEDHQRTARVHKLVYEAFTGDICDGYDRDRTINHIDGDKTNNQIENLERISQRENQLHAVKLGLQPVDGRKVICLDTNEIFESLTAAARAIGGRKGEMVARVCRGEKSHYRNRHYAFLDDFCNHTIPAFSGNYTKKASAGLWR